MTVLKTRDQRAQRKRPTSLPRGLGGLSSAGLAAGAGALALSAATMLQAAAPPPPKPERIEVEALPLPPTSPSETEGACTPAVNPRRTGCMSTDMDAILEGPAYLWDAKHVLATIMFAGAPASPDPASMYTGPQVVAIRTDGGRFANGDPWKCITCGIPADNLKGANFAGPNNFERPTKTAPGWLVLDHPQAFPGDRKMLAGSHIIDCGPYKLVDAACTPDRLKVFPLRWNMSPDGSGPGGSMRELRLNPDGVHLMWNHMNQTVGEYDQHALVGRLVFNHSPRTGEPRVPRYELEDVTILTNTNDPTFVFFRADPEDPSRLIFNPMKGAIGEARGWTRDGKDAVGMGMPEAGAVDMYITSLKTGESERLTSAPGYADPIMMSPDDRWFVVLDNRTVDRHMYYGAMQGIPPLTDLLTRMVMLNPNYGYRNGTRRFFQPFLIDRWGDRGDYAGQQINAGPPTAGSPSDPDWNARADPAWSPNGTNIVYWQSLATTPDCGGANRPACPVSTEPGGRHARLMIARLPDRKPLPLGRTIPPADISVPWGTPYKPGDPMPQRYPFAPAGKFTLHGRSGGSAQVEIRNLPNGRIGFVSASYTRYTDDGSHVIDGKESAELVIGKGQPKIVWRSDLTASGRQSGTKKTSEPGGFVLSLMGQPLEGELVTTIGGKTYKPPRPGT